MLRVLATGIFTFILLAGIAQPSVIWSGHTFRNDAERHAVQQPARSHLSIRPHPAPTRLPGDSPTILNSLTQRYVGLSANDTTGIAFLPIANAFAGYSSSAREVFHGSAGLAVIARPGKRWLLQGDFIAGIDAPPQYVRSFADSLGILPSLGRATRNGSAYSFFAPNARLAYQPSSYFEFELGFGRHFIGNGYRSLFLSDAAFSYPYLKITTSVWNIRYVNIFSALRDIRPELRDGPFRAKYTTTHYLSWAVVPRFNIGLFETIVWQGRDGDLKRGFDPHYLNPVIFYRPVEFSVGSPDNALIGLDLSYKAGKEWLLYGQLLFDEFLLSEFRDRSGWWGNKWGVQGGAAWHGSAGQNQISARGEVNVARPFTYTHGSVLQNFGHYNQPLAHVLGTNFYEAIVFATFQQSTFFAEAQFMQALYGRDNGEENFGGDIYRSYINPARQFENKIAQGVKSRLYFGEITAGKVLSHDLQLRLFVRATMRHLSTKGVGPEQEYIISVGLSTLLRNAYRDF